MSYEFVFNKKIINQRKNISVADFIEKITRMQVQRSATLDVKLVNDVQNGFDLVVNAYGEDSTPAICR